MSTATIIYILVGGLVGLIGIAARVFMWRSGRDKERLKNAEKTIDAVKKGNIAAADDSHDDKLREKYGID